MLKASITPGVKKFAPVTLRAPASYAVATQRRLLLGVLGKLGGEGPGHSVDALHHLIDFPPRIQPTLELCCKLIWVPPPDASMVRQLHLTRPC